MKTYKVARPSSSQAYQPTPIDFLAYDLGQNPDGHPVVLYTDSSAIDRNNLEPLLFEIKLGFGPLSADASVGLFINDWGFEIGLSETPFANLHLGLHVGSSQAGWSIGGGIFDTHSNTYTLPSITPRGSTGGESSLYKLQFALQWSGFDLNYVHIQTHYANRQ